MGTTLAEKVWADHVVTAGQNNEPDLIYIDLHLVHEVTSPQAFEGLRLAGRKVRRPDRARYGVMKQDRETVGGADDEQEAGRV